MPRDMSWLSPKRRRTTTALPTVHSGRKNGVDEQPLSPSPRFTSPKPVLPSPGLKQRASRTFSTASSTSATAAPDEEGNLFYAYARQVRWIDSWQQGGRDTNVSSPLPGRRPPPTIPAYLRFCASRKRMVDAGPVVLS